VPPSDRIFPEQMSIESNLLRALRAADYRLLAPFLQFSERQGGELIYKPRDNVATVHFPCGPSLVSFQVTNADGHDVETVLIGREGAVGGIVSTGNLPAYCRIIVKFGGPFAQLPVAQLEAAKLQSHSLRSLFSRYADCLLAQVFQSTACNAIHSIEQRTAKWIMAAMERTGDHIVPLTHEELATMLGVGRSYTSRVIQVFKADGLLETRRGALVVTDRDALVARSCQCNASVKEHFDEVLRGVYPEPE
jgi:DNA-binding transcriptional regulator YhcF (GntR family)